MRPLALVFVLALVPLLCGLSARPCLAGAWPREEGRLFVHVATRLSWSQDLTTWTSYEPTGDYQTLYLEYGLTERVTLGLDMGHAVSGSGKSIGFVQLPLRRADTGVQISAQLGFGQISGKSVVRPGLCLGWGHENGWTSVESVAEIQLDTGMTDWKMDLTWGRKLSRDRMLILQLQTGIQENDPAFARFAPSYVQPLNDRIKVELGATYGLEGDTSMGLKLGLWTEF